MCVGMQISNTVTSLKAIYPVLDSINDTHTYTYTHAHTHVYSYSYCV